MLSFIFWLLLVVICWPLALLALLLFPLLWLLSLPFVICGFAIGGILAFIKALFYLPARILGYRS